jgi:hypothetical protein
MVDDADSACRTSWSTIAISSMCPLTVVIPAFRKQRPALCDGTKQPQVLPPRDARRQNDSSCCG